MTELSRRSTTAPGQPTFSLVISCYNVAAYLPAFLDSLAAQTVRPGEVELIFVNDGSTDDSDVLIRDWVSATNKLSKRTRVIDQENGGLCAARNTGLALATGTWLSFPDPDDILDRTYLSRVQEFIAAQASVPDLLCTHVLWMDDAKGQVSDSHPLSAKFSAGNQVVNMEYCPEYIHLQAASAFYQRARVAELGLRFDGAIKPNFEDASFTALYLAESDEPLMGIVADADYLYRRRSDGSSLVQQSWAKEEKYTTVLEFGYLKLLRQVKARRGSVPTWLQNTVLYDILFYFRHEQSTHGGTGMAKPEWAKRFQELAEQIFAHIDTDTIDAFSAMPTSRQLKDALIIGYRRERQVPDTVRLVRVDIDQQIVQIRYFYGGDLPREAFWADGTKIEPIYAKVRDLTYLGRVLVRERILWLPATAETRVSLNGRRMPLEFGPAPTPVYAARATTIWRRLTRRGSAPLAPIPLADGGPRPELIERPSLDRRIARTVRKHLPAAVPALRRLKRAVTRQALSTDRASGPFVDLDPRRDDQLVRQAMGRQARTQYAQAWTFMDRDTEAHDNAEHLYRYVLRHRPEVNAWFVLRRDSPDWDRLADEGFRLVPYGTGEHVLLLLNTIHLVSSQIDHYVVRPLDAARFGRKAWRFTFLQHGVTKDDLSRWINVKPISRFVTATVDEFTSIAGDHTPYVFTEKEVRLTGFPRHDRLLALRANIERPRLLLIMPTWRRSLMTEAPTGNTRRLRAPLGSTTFGRSWFDLIGSPELKAIADESGLDVVFMPHPNMQAYIVATDLPSWVRVCTYDSSDVQELLVDAAVVITDYSSQAFEAAYLESAVVYYQFDQAEFFGGAHVYRKGSWDYAADGFGPIATTYDEALLAIEDAARRAAPDEPYRSRMKSAFPHRDGRCCERTFDSIVSLSEPVTYEQAFVPAVPADQPHPQSRPPSPGDLSVSRASGRSLPAGVASAGRPR